MNSIKFPRRRPRVDSISFRSFFWLLRMESAYQVTNHARALHALGPIARDRVPMDRTAIFVARALKLAKLTPALRRIE